MSTVSSNRLPRPLRERLPDKTSVGTRSARLTAARNLSCPCLARCTAAVPCAVWRIDSASRGNTSSGVVLTYPMSLVVAGISPRGRIVAVADTKITWPEVGRDRRVWEEARPKLLILRPDLLVGVTGDDYERIGRDLAALREVDLDRFLAAAAQMPGADLVVASTAPSRLWRLRNGEVVERTNLRRAWAGDHEAYESFRHLEGAESETPDFGQFLQAPMQTVANLGGHATVGGAVIRVDECGHGFGYAPTPMQIAEPATDGHFTLRPDGSVSLKFSVPSVFSVCTLTGQDPTRGAFAFHFGQAEIGILYRDDSPWSGHNIRAVSCDELIRRAREEHGQVLSTAACPAEVTI